MTIARYRVPGIWVAVALSAVIFSGCVVIERNINAWEGHPIDELIDSWGEPTSSTALGQDFIAYSWVSEDGDCEQTFTARDGKIIGVSDTGCSS